jgi:ribosomal protein S18 acetylase RimI-like enzyme
MNEWSLSRVLAPPTESCWDVVDRDRPLRPGHDRAMATSFEIRRADQRDLPAVGRLGAALVRQHHDFDPARFMAPTAGLDEGYAWFLGTQLSEPGVVIFVAEAPGAPPRELLGYVYAGLEPQSWKELRDPAGFIHDVVVDPAARRQGVATGLLEAAAAWLEEQGAPRVMLWTAEQNPVAQRLFARLGFRRTMIEMTRERRASPR